MMLLRIACPAPCPRRDTADTASSRRRQRWRTGSHCEGGTGSRCRSHHAGYCRIPRGIAAQRRLRVAQRRVARRKKGASNRRKAVVILQNRHNQVANQRKDYVNKLAHDLVKRYDRIALEDLTITRMVHGNLAKSMLDAGWGYLVQRLMHKAASAGRVVVLVDPRGTSKTCSGCGTTFEGLTPADRWVTCRCGMSLDRDCNAAINIKNQGGQLRWGISSPLGGLPQEAAAL